jgi:hypothetical protein
VDFVPRAPRWAPRIVIQAHIGDDGRIREVYLVQATKKLAAFERTPRARP